MLILVESEQILHLKVGYPNFGPVRGSAIYPNPTEIALNLDLPSPGEMV